MPMDNVTLENTQQSISSRDAKSVASVMVNGKWVNLSDTLEQANVKSDVGTVSKQVAEQQTVITSAVAQADSAVAYANDAIEKSRVNQQAIVEINSAVSDAVSDAAVARSDGLRAWDAAQSNVDLIDLNYASASAAISSARTEAIAAADEAKASASAAQADIVAVRSDVAAVRADVTTTKSDVAVAKNDIVKAKSDATAGINAVRSDVATAKSDIADTKTSLTSQAKSLSSYAAQASAAGKDITTLKSQAGQLEQDMADTKGDVSQLKVSASSASAALSDAAGNISSLQATAKSYSAALSDTNSNVASVTATASELETKYADAAGDIDRIKTTAKGTAETIADAQGDIASLKKRADGFDTQFADTKGNISKLQSDASGTKQTLTNAKSDIAVLQSRADGFDVKYADTAGNIDQIQADAKGMTQTISNAQGDIAKLKIRADGFDTEFASTNGDINKLQTDASGTKQTLTNAKSDIAVLQSRADGFDAKYADTAGDINTIKVNAKGMQQTLTNAKGDISTLQATATGFKNTLTDAQGNISTLQSDVSGLKKTTSDHAGNIATLQADAKTLTSQMADAQGNISTLQQTASGFSSKVSGMETSLADANSKIDGITSNGGGTNILRNTDPAKIDNVESSSTWVLGSGGNGQAKVITLPNVFIAKNGFEIYGNTSGNRDFTQRPIPWDNAKYVFSVYAKIADVSDRTSVDMMTRAWSNQAGRAVFENHHTLTSKNWVRVTMNIDASSFYTQSGVSLAFGLSGIGSIDLAEPMLEKGMIAHDWLPAPEDTDAKITTNSTAIEQNKKAITLKADQTTVDKTNGTVQYLQSQLKVQADQINAKVSSSDLPKLVGKGGQNLLQGTLPTDKNNLNGWSIANGRIGTHAFLDDGTTNMFILRNSTTKENFLWSPFVSLEKGKTYTLSYYAFATSNTANSGEVYATTQDYSETQEIAYPTKLSPNRAVRYVYTFTFNRPSGKYHLRFDNNGTTDGKDADMFIGKPMLEKGTIAHEWAPASADAQTYTQTQIKQTADSWNANLTSVKNGLTDKYTNLHATVDGIQAQVYNKDGSSKITQLSNLIATKVSSGDYNSQITQLKNDINLRVAKGNVVSQINQEAGGNTLIQVSNGQGKLALNASSVIFSGSAFIPDAYISTLNADKLRFYDNSGNVATMSAGLKQYDDDKSNKTIVLQYSGGYEVHASNLLGSILTMHDNTIRLAVKAHGADTGQSDQYSGFYAMQHYAQLSCYRSNGSAPGIYITDDGYTIKGDESGNGTKWGDLYIVSPQIHVRGSNAAQMQVNKTHAWLSDGMLHLYKDGDSSSTATKLQVDGWAWVNGWVEAAGHSQHSALSTKTDIQSVDDDKMLKMVNDTDLATFLYKTDVANGETHRHIGLIIDDVHDVAQYQTPQDFIAPNGVSRDDDNMIGALFGAVKALTKRLKTLESKVG